MRSKIEAMENMLYDEAVELSQDSQESLRDSGDRGAKAVFAGAKEAAPGRLGEAEAKGGVGGLRGEEKLTNQAFDEACDLEDDDDSVDTADLRARQQAGQHGKGSGVPSAAAGGGPKKSSAEPQRAAAMAKPAEALSTAAAAKAGPRSPESSEGSEEESTGEDGGGGLALEGAYNPADYADLKVTADVRDLFSHITRFTAHEVELESTLKCFIPDFIPAVGEIDAFIKVPRPDAERDDLGLAVLDEPAATQSDATVLELQLRAVSKKQHGDVAVRSIENAAKNPLEIERWISSIADLHRARPPPQVNYRRPMPDIDKLMEEWPPEFEDLLRDVSLPNADLEASLAEFARIACAIMDIPVYDNIVESLHVFFSLYLEFADNVHFAAMSQNPNLGNNAADTGSPQML